MNIKKVREDALKIINKENSLVIKELKNIKKFDIDFEKRVLNSSIKKLKNMYLSKELSIYDCILIHWKQINNWENKINCVTEYCYHEAIKQCKILSCKLENYKKIEDMPPFFGIPYSCKDEEYMKGYYSTYGCTVGLKKKKEKDDTIVKIVRDNGGVIIVRGNIPQLLMTCESVNYIFGRSNNPYDLNRTVGGSTGGDAGIVAIGGAKIGLGRDIAGSIRIPASFCGLFGFKPSSNRIIDKNISDFKGVIPKYTKCAKGIFSRNLNDLTLHMKTYLRYDIKKNMNLLKPKIKFNKKLYKEYKNPNKVLRIGYIDEIDVYPVSQPIKNVLNEVKKKCKNHILIEVNEIKDIIKKLLVKYILCMFDSGSDYSHWENEDVIEEYKYNKLIEYFPYWAKVILFKFLKIIGEKRIHHILNTTLSLKYNRHYSNEIHLLFYEFESICKKYDIDCILMPPLPFPAIKHKQSKDLAIGCGYYFSIFNLLDVPTSVIPIRLIKKDEQIYEDNINNKDSIYKETKKCLKDSEGISIGIQLISIKNSDEKLLGIMKHFENFIELDLNHNINK